MDLPPRSLTAKAPEKRWLEDDPLIFRGELLNFGGVIAHSPRHPIWIISEILVFFLYVCIMANKLIHKEQHQKRCGKNPQSPFAPRFGSHFWA